MPGGELQLFEVCNSTIPTNLSRRKRMEDDDVVRFRLGENSGKKTWPSTHPGPACSHLVFIARLPRLTAGSPGLPHVAGHDGRIGSWLKFGRCVLARRSPNFRPFTSTCKRELLKNVRVAALFHFIEGRSPPHRGTDPTDRFGEVLPALFIPDVNREVARIQPRRRCGRFHELAFMSIRTMAECHRTLDSASGFCTNSVCRTTGVGPRTRNRSDRDDSRVLANPLRLATETAQETAEDGLPVLDRSPR